MINCDKNFKKGLVMGSLLGGILVALGMSQKGKEIREKVVDYAQELSSELKKKAIEWGETTKETYNEMVRRAVEEFARQKGLALETKEAVIEKLEDKWDEIQSEIVFRKVKNRFKNEAEKTTENFEKLVHEIVDEYESRKNLPAYFKYRLVKDLKRRFDELLDESETTSTKGWQ